jgi:hypothetical protein
MEAVEVWSICALAAEDWSICALAAGLWYIIFHLLLILGYALILLPIYGQLFLITVGIFVNLRLMPCYYVVAGER